MKTSSLGIALLASVALGCSDSAAGPGSNGEATPAQLVGTWVGSSYIVTSLASTALSADLFDLGMTLSITFTETSYTGVSTFPGELDENFSGTYTISGNQITTNEVGQTTPEIFTYSLSGSILTMSGDDETYDFSSGNGNPQEEPATFVMILNKQ